MSVQRRPVSDSLQINGIALGYHEWPAENASNDPCLIIAHATGFHGRCYGAIADHFPERRVIALDLRGHGTSEGEPVDSWVPFADDLCQFVDQMGIRGAIGVGHSMGAHTMLRCAAKRANAFRNLILFDPVIMPPEVYAQNEIDLRSEVTHPTSRRKRYFASPEAMMQRFAERDPYALFDPRVFEDYCRYGLTKVKEGEYQLACLPEMEASIYMSSRNNAGIFEAARSVKVPCLVVRAQRTNLSDFKGSPTWPGLAEIIPNGHDLYRPDRTHFHPFEDPVDAARIIADFIGG